MKFRVYDNKEKRIYSPEEVDENNWALGSTGQIVAIDEESFKDGEIKMWITDWRKPLFSINRKDKNGNVIYQGDILKFTLDPILADTVSCGQAEQHFIVSENGEFSDLYNAEFEYNKDIMGSPAVLTVEIIGNTNIDGKKYGRIPELQGLLATEQEQAADLVTEDVSCDLCSHTWTAMYYTESEKLECPNCNNMANFESCNTEEDG